MGLRHAVRPRAAVVTTLIAGAVAALAAPAALASAAAAAAPGAAIVVDAPKGAGKPTAGSGMGTQAALDNPRCQTDERYGVYGRFDTSVVGAGPLCVRPFEAGEDNGGATARGVTADSVKVVAVIPSAAAQTSAGASAGANPTNRAANTPGTYEDAVHDYLLSVLPFYETWGRDIAVSYYVSTGSDEAAQRADAVAILAEKPFAVLNFDSAGLDVLESQVAKAKTLVIGYGTSANEALAQAPYRWGATDIEASAVNSAEVLGKQLVGKKAQYGGDDVKGQTRKIGVVAIEDSVDLDRFADILGDHKGTVAVELEYPGSGGTFGDPTVSAQQAPVFVGRMKDAGVTTVALFTDVGMNKALMEQATAQGWFPEWFMTGSSFYDIAVLARSYPADQSRHMFGLAALGPWLLPDPSRPGANTGLDWYWGSGVGTTSPRVLAQIGWLLNGVHLAGPDLTVKTFKQGLWAQPANGGSATDNPLIGMTGFGKTTGLPYDGYIAGVVDFAPGWMDPDTEGPSAGTGTIAKHVTFYIDGGTRYRAGTWPKSLPWFDKSESVVELDAYPANLAPPAFAPACDAGTCPATGAASPTPGTPDDSGFVAEIAAASANG